MSWYRLYRPQTVHSLHIQSVRERFQQILDTGCFNHAYLLCGPKGTGKTSGARILAKILNCQKNKDTIELILGGKVGEKTISLLEPCNQCPTCFAITEGQSMCVTEMDAASNRGIDDIRLLTEKIGLSAGDGMIAVYIIDEVHMLTTEAFNALLKVLEEPPAHVVFILATTERQKVPETVVSRCQVIMYRKAKKDEIRTALQQVTTSEGITIEAQALEQIVLLSDGSLRDAVKLLETVGQGKKEINVADTEKILGQSIGKISEDLLAALSKKDTHKVLAIFQLIETESMNGFSVQKAVIDALHTRLIEAPQQKSPHLPTYIQLLKKLHIDLAPSLFLPHLPFEIACLEWCEQGKTIEVGTSAVVDLRPQIEDQFTLKGESSSPVVLVTIEKEDDANITFSAAPPREKDLYPKKTDSTVLEESSVSATTSIVEFSTLLEKWYLILREVKTKNSSLEALLRSTKPIGIAKGFLEIEAFYQFHKEQLEVERNRQHIEQSLQSILGKRLKVTFSLAKKAQKAAVLEDSNISGKVDDVSLVKAAEEAFL